MEDTIAAVSTPFGVAAIGMVRLSGPMALEVAGRVFRANSGRPLSGLPGYSGLLGHVFDGDGPLDEAIAFVYRAPRSYTGEDVVELSCHGGTYVLQRTLRSCLDRGARPAQPGEFTRRAFLNGKLSLDQAEAVMNIISAKGEASLRAAVSAREGALSTGIAAVVEKLLAQSAHIAAWADYPEEEIALVERESLAEVLREALHSVGCLLSTYDRGRLLREGIAAVIVGKPNVGKSTLMNLLSGFSRSIVTEIPGTTRDVVEDSIRLGDYLLRLSDTAGIRETGDAVERIGVARAREKLREADLVLAVFDGSCELDGEDFELLTLLRDKLCIAVLNKNDLPGQAEIFKIKALIPRAVTLSARSGEGRELLERAILDALRLTDFDPSAPLLSNERQRACLQDAQKSLTETLSALEEGVTLDAVGVCIDYALDALLSLTGERATEAVVEEVFSRFCVGK